MRGYFLLDRRTGMQMRASITRACIDFSRVSNFASTRSATINLGKFMFSTFSTCINKMLHYSLNCSSFTRAASSRRAQDNNHK